MNCLPVVVRYDACIQPQALWYIHVSATAHMHIFQHIGLARFHNIVEMGTHKFSFCCFSVHLFPIHRDLNLYIVAPTIVVGPGSFIVIRFWPDNTNIHRILFIRIYTYFYYCHIRSSCSPENIISVLHKLFKVFLGILSLSSYVQMHW